MDELVFLHDLAVVMIVAGLVTVVFHRFKQPVVLGYILAGLIIGPHTPPFPLIRDEHTIKTLANLGVILLMFCLGLEFSLRKLKQVGVTAFVAAFLEILLMVWVGYTVGRFFGWSTMDRIFLGAMLSISSTTIIVKALAELGKSKEPFAELMFGILVIEDVLGIVMIALLSGIAMTGGLRAEDVGVTLGKLAIFLAVALVAGLLAVPRLLQYIAKYKSNEMLLVFALGLCFGFSLFAVKLGYSVALGAFIIGAVIAESQQIAKIERLVEPVRDMFSAVFFVAIGLLIDPHILIEHWGTVVVISVAVIVGKVASCTFGTFVGGHDTRTSLRVGMGLAQIGEFSFIIAALGESLKVTSKFLYPIAVAVSVVTTLTTPYLIRSSDGLVGWFDRHAPRSMVNYFEGYTRWVGEYFAEKQSSRASRLVKRWFWQMALNALLIAGLFISAAYIDQRQPEWLKQTRLEGEVLHGALWLAAMVLSLPLLIATFRKLQALGLMVAELNKEEALASGRIVTSERTIAQAVPIAGMVAMGIFLLLLSSALLPMGKELLALLVVAALIGGLMWRYFIRLYSKAQIALQETFAHPPVPRHTHDDDQQHTGMFYKANSEKVLIKEGSPGAQKKIRELRLRSLSGANIVGIERDGNNLISPGPDEVLRIGDKVLLLGSSTQLAAARALLVTAS
jgi:CPA2 family monovalent cation:H+ antiporter-2